jgi:hypothetical protein
MSTNPKTANQILADEFLIARAKILELAAFLDRVERASGDATEMRSMQLIANGLDILTDGENEKAKRVQLLMSRQYESDWKTKMSIGS